jgi:protein-disulfide isomerase
MLRLAIAFSFTLLAGAPAAAQRFNQQEQTEIRAIVRDYLVENPDVLREALDALETRVSAQRWREVASDGRDFSIGPANAAVTIVEFFDYRCPYCAAAYEWVREITRTRSDVRLVLKELPVLGEGSFEAAHASLAAMPQGRYWEFHRALITYSGELTPAAVDRLARQAGIDVARMRRAMGSPEIQAHLAEIRAQAVEYQFNGTPGFVINGETIHGFDRPALEARLRAATREARALQQAQR